jgi:hypothetical protein
MIHALRGDLPPPAGERWLLDGDARGQLVTSHPILGDRRYELNAAGGTLTGLAGGQFELALAVTCRSESAAEFAPPIGLIFHSASIARPGTFRYLAKGDVHLGSNAGITVLRLHDLSWIAGQSGQSDTRILTMAATLDRQMWEAFRDVIRAPWLIRDSAEIYLHTEWTAPSVTTPAA